MKKFLVVLVAIFTLFAFFAPSTLAARTGDKSNFPVIFEGGSKPAAVSPLTCSNNTMTSPHFNQNYNTWVQFSSPINTVNHAIRIVVNFDPGSAAADVRITDGYGHYWPVDSQGTPYYLVFNSTSNDQTIAVSTSCGPWYVQVSSASMVNNTFGTLTAYGL